jgi:hypothetical protein
MPFEATAVPDRRQDAGSWKLHAARGGTTRRASIGGVHCKRSPSSWAVQHPSFVPRQPKGSVVPRSRQAAWKSPVGALVASAAIGRAEGAIDYGVSSGCHTWSGLLKEAGVHAALGLGEGIGQEFIPVFGEAEGDHAALTGWWSSLTAVPYHGGNTRFWPSHACRLPAEEFGARLASLRC